MRIGRTSTICLLSIAAAYAAAFVACGGESSGTGSSGTSTTNTTNTTNTTSTTIVITGGGGAGGGTTGGTGGSGGTFDPDAACVAEPRAGEQLPIDLFFMVDKSGSMDCPVPPAPGMPDCQSGPTPTPAVTRWTSIKDALNQFFAAPTSAGISAGMGFFPLMNGNQLLCMASDYAMPAAQIALLPGAAGTLQMALNANMPNGNTPTVPALGGAIQYVKSYAMAHPGRTVAIVFATDGVPTQCTPNNTVPLAAMAAQAAFAGTPPIRTFVLGVGPSLTSLNQIAAAGGTTAAHLVEMGGSAELLAALNDIRKGTLTCDYTIPIIPGKVIDYNLVAIKVKVGSTGAEQLVAKVDGPAQCGPTQGGWYFDNPPPAIPTKITLCPATCNPLLMTMGSSLTVLMGCRIIVPPPN